MRPRCDELTISEKPLNSYGSLETTIQAIRNHRPLDLNAEQWRITNPTGTHAQWTQQAMSCVRNGLHYDAGPLALQTETLDRHERDGLIIERVQFNSAPWFRLDGYFLMPAGATGPLPGMVVMHAWGGPMIFGKDRIVNSGRDHPLLQEFRASTYGGTYLAEECARQGYAVIVIDAYHFGGRAPRGIGDIPIEYDPFSLSVAEATLMHQRSTAQLYYGLKELMWAGTTWMGVNFNDDSRCVDYLLSRPEVDPKRIGCTGLSGGAWRTNILAALDHRVSASVSVGWMSTGDHQQLYNLSGAIGTFCLLPGVWSQLDLPDLPIMGAPCASMVVIGELDDLVPQNGVREAVRQIDAGYRWAGHPDRFRYFHPAKKHVYDREVQTEAFAWFGRWLKNA